MFKESTKNRGIFIAVSFLSLFFILFRWKEALPFTNKLSNPSYEVIAMFGAYLVAAQEGLHFPLGVVQNLSYPFNELTNLGATGAISLFAIFFKLLGVFIPYFKTFYYFSLIEILSFLFLAYFSLKSLVALGVRSKTILFFGVFFSTLSSPILVRSLMQQTFAVLCYPLYASFLYSLILWSKGNKKWTNSFQILIHFPIAAAIDNYTLVGISILGSAFAGILFFENILSEKSFKKSHLFSYCATLVFGLFLAVFTLFIVGLFPFPKAHFTFTSFDFGMGGRYHVADIFSPWMAPSAEGLSQLKGWSIVSTVFPFLSTERFSPGQYEGFTYIGTGPFFLTLFIICIFTWNFISYIFLKKIPIFTLLKTKFYFFDFKLSIFARLLISASALFIFSWGYEWHFLGQPLSFFPYTLGGVLSDIFKPLYNIRGQGRLTVPMFFILIWGGVLYFDKILFFSKKYKYWMTLLFLFCCLHLYEVSSFFWSKVETKNEFSNFPYIFNPEEIQKIKEIAAHHQVLLFSPSVNAAEESWVAQAYALTFLLGIPSNIFYVARYTKEQNDFMTKTILDISEGRLREVFERNPKALVITPKNLQSPKFQATHVLNAVKELKLNLVELKDLYFIYL